MIYYGTRLSDNISRREPEGYLLCLNVPVARTGTQEYLPEELGLPPGRELIPVHRPEEEVFSPATIASFEGMPVTNDHPFDPDGVTTENVARLQKGHAHNIRRGTGEEADLLLADLMITDPHLIDLILNEGKREISCGYNYTLCEENGQYIQRQIRGNHVAVVEAGRAGPRVCIKDAKGFPLRGSCRCKPTDEVETVSSCQHLIIERRTNMKNRKLARFIARIAKDGDIEEVAELIGELIDPEAAPAGELQELRQPDEDPVAEAAPAEPLPAEPTPKPDPLREILTKLDQLIALLTPVATDDDPAGEIAEAVEEALEAAETVAPADPLTELAEELTGAPEPELPADPIGLAAELIAGAPEGLLSEVIEPEAADECGDPDPDRVTADAIRAAIRAVRPALAKMPKQQRAAVTADLAKRLRKISGRPAATSDTYAALRRVSARKHDDADLGRRIMAKRNPCVK